MPETVTSDDAQYALDLVRTICSTVGPGLPGSRQERQRAEIIRSELASRLGEENVAIEEFELAPAAFLGVFPLAALLIALATLAYVSVAGLSGAAAWLPLPAPWACPWHRWWRSSASTSCTTSSSTAFPQGPLAECRWHSSLARGQSEEAVDAVRPPRQRLGEHLDWHAWPRPLCHRTDGTCSPTSSWQPPVPSSWRAWSRAVPR